TRHNTPRLTTDRTKSSPTKPALASLVYADPLNTETYSLSLHYALPISQDTGKITFEVCTTSNCSSSLGTFDSTSTALAVNANGSAAVPAGFNLANGTTYYWRAKNVDGSAASSAYSATRSFLVDTAAATMSRSEERRVGTTGTASWSQNLDQTQDVPSADHSNPTNGEADVVDG